MVDWKYWLKRNLTRLEAKVESLEAMETELQEIDAILTGIGSSTKDVPPVSGGVTSREDMYINLISRKEEIKLARKVTEMEINTMTTGLSQLSESDRFLIESMYVKRRPVDVICRELHMERSTLYERVNRAMATLAVYCYGSAG